MTHTERVYIHTIPLRVLVLVVNCVSGTTFYVPFFFAGTRAAVSAQRSKMWCLLYCHPPLSFSVLSPWTPDNQVTCSFPSTCGKKGREREGEGEKTMVTT